MKVLSVDDLTENLYLMESLLKGYGYEVASVHNGCEALAKLEEEPFDLIVSDILMPQMDGFQLCREIKKNDRLKKIPFIFYTATYTDKKDEELALSLGASRFIIKPVEPAEFAEIISAVIREHKDEGLPVPQPEMGDEVYLRAYNQSLIHKLEDKLQQLEASNRKLQEALEERDREMAERMRAEEERKEIESHLTQVQRLEAIGVLAGGIAHDFNNILSAIIGYAELCKVQMKKEDPISAYVDQVLKAGIRAKELVHQILTFSRQAKQEMKPVMLSLVVKEALSLLKATLPTSIEIRESIDDPGIVMSDPTQVHQIVMNLCTNAAHAMGKTGGALDVRLEKVKVDRGPEFRDLDLAPGPYLRMTIADSGHGMSQEIMKRIFEPYFTTKEQGRGTGLGLSVVHGIVKNHEGAITCKSTPGKGTTFMVYLPEFEPEGAPLDTPGEDHLPTGTERILFVDDEQDIVDMVQKMMEGLGYKLTAQTSSMEALELFRRTPDEFDLVITDLTMPGMMGDQLAQRLIEIREDIPIVLYTGYGELIAEQAAKNIGIVKFLTKPMEIKDLACAVRNVLDGK